MGRISAFIFTQTKQCSSRLLTASSQADGEDVAASFPETTTTQATPQTEKKSRELSGPSTAERCSYRATPLSLSTPCTGEGHGTPLQCSCLQNPRDGGAWWAAGSGVAQSRTRLKRLRSSSSSILYCSLLNVQYKTMFFFFKCTYLH